MNVRSRRLQADYEQIKQGLGNHPAISVRGVSGSPPEKYQIEYRVRSLVERADGTISEGGEHVAEIYLTLAYPKQAPQCRMLTPVFHPNVAPHAICIGDHWAAGEALLNLVVRIGEILAYQSYNTQSPLNGAAARWVEEHADLVPTDARDLSLASWTDAGREAPETGQCQNCHGAGTDLRACANGHEVCPDCLIECTRCGRTYCLLCKLETCSVCARLVCEPCRAACPQCSRTVCVAHLEACVVCEQKGCPDCSIECSTCGRQVCLAHVTQCAVCREALCADHARTCAACAKSLCAEHVVACSVCGRDGCADCTFPCRVCGVHVCVDHVAQCAVCRAVLCPDHRLTCTACKRAVCETDFVAESGTCVECQKRNGRAPEAASGLVFRCSSCEVKLKVSSEHAGRRVKCPRCGTIGTAE